MNAYLAKVVSGSGKRWVVTPQIIEHDGTIHPDITASAQEGITPAIGDTVLCVVMHNNISEKLIHRVFRPTEANSVIVGVMTTSSGYTLTGDFTFIGDFLIEGALSITGDLAVGGDISADGTIDAVGDITAGPVGVKISLLTHTHTNNAPTPGPTGQPLP